MTWTDILITIISTAVTALLSWGIAKLTKWVDSKIGDSKKASMLNNAIFAVSNAVKATWQTYVQAIKGTEAWTKEAQTAALNKAVKTAKEQLSAEVQEYITENFGSLDKWLVSQVESTIYDLKIVGSASKTTE
ncbi:MAG: hypothetical protein IJB32_05795 [Clostridia bacterium]|nr:hypothetical protein [Clostridia bacterium]